MDVVVAVAQSHDLSVVADGSDLEGGRELCAADHPAVVSSHEQSLGQSVEDRVVAKLCALGGTPR